MVMAGDENVCCLGEKCRVGPTGEEGGEHVFALSLAFLRLEWTPVRGVAPSIFISGGLESISHDFNNHVRFG